MMTNNEFILPIVMKSKKHDFKAWLKLRSTLKIIDKISPDFNTLMEIRELVEYCHRCYMHTYYDGNPLHLFPATLPKGYKIGEAYTMIYKEDKFVIKFVLVPVEKEIIIEINRNTTNNQPTEKISFIDGEYEFKDIYDEEKFRFIISSLMNGVKELMIHFYKIKRF